MNISSIDKPIGLTIKGEVVNWHNTKQGVTIVTGMPSTGKTTIAKNIACMTQSSCWNLYGRKVIYVDIYGDAGILYPQTSVFGIVSIGLKAKILFNPLFYFHEYDYDDFLTVGFTPGASKILTVIARYLSKYDLDYNSRDLDLIISVIPKSERDLASANEKLSKFQVEGDKFFEFLQNQKAVESCQNRFKLLKNTFWFGNRFDYVEDLKTNNLYIMFPSISEFELRARFGKVLKVLNTVIDDYFPLIIVDEADKFCPNLAYLGSDVLPTSNYFLYQLLFKEQRRGVHILFIVQYEDQIDERFKPAIKNFIVGAQTDKKYEKVKLKFDHESNIREFAIKYLNNQWLVFNPLNPVFEVRNVRQWSMNDFEI